MVKRALITGITGQDGSYLAELLLSKGYEVHGINRSASSFNTRRIDHLYVDPHVANARLFLRELVDGSRTAVRTPVPLSDAVIGDPSKAESLLGRKAQIQTPELIKIMVDADIQALEGSAPIHVDRPQSPDWNPGWA